MVELRPKEVQKPSKENTRRQRESTVYMSGKKNALTLLRLRLTLGPRKPCRPVGDQTLVGQVIEICLGDGRADPIPLDPTLWQAGS